MSRVMDVRKTIMLARLGLPKSFKLEKVISIDQLMACKDNAARRLLLGIGIKERK